MNKNKQMNTIYTGSKPHSILYIHFDYFINGGGKRGDFLPLLAFVALNTVDWLFAVKNFFTSCLGGEN